MDEDVVKIGDFKSIEEVYKGVDQYLELLKMYDEEEYERMLEEGVIHIVVDVVEEPANPPFKPT